MIERPTPYIFDVDDVLIPWRKGFMAWMHRDGHVPVSPAHDASFMLAFPNLTRDGLLAKVEQYSRSTEYRNLELVSGAWEAFRQLRAERPDHLFIAVTCCGLDIVTRANRHWQLHTLPLDAVIPLPVGASKLPVYQQFVPGVVFEDRTPHIDEAKRCGHITIGVHQPWNREAQPDIWMDNWKSLDIRGLP